jgi:hypothetical protein
MQYTKDNHKYFKRYCSNCGFLHAIRLKCTDRFCRLCCKADYKRLYDKYLPVVENSNYLAHLTLNLKNKKYLNGLVVQELLNYFNTFRNDAYIKRKIRGGLAVIECKHSYKTEDWNLHIHCLLDCEFIPQDYISKLWKRITGDSDNVYIKEVANRYKVGPRAIALHYLLKYVLKPPVVNTFNGVRMYLTLKEDYNNAFFKTRHIVAFGSFYDATFNLEEDEPFDLVCPVCGGIVWLDEYQWLHKGDRVPLFRPS